VIAGEGPSNCTSRADVWSYDGQNWSQATANAGFPGRDWHTATVFKGQIFVIGGINRSTACSASYLADVWASPDGINWTKTADGVFPARAGHNTLVYDDKLWVIGGTNNWPLATQSDVWFSSDGTSWCPATNDYQFSNRYGSSSAVFLDRMWIIGGNDYSSGLRNDIWTSQ